MTIHHGPSAAASPRPLAVGRLVVTACAVAYGSVLWLDAVQRAFGASPTRGLLLVEVVRAALIALVVTVPLAVLIVRGPRRSTRRNARIDRRALIGGVLCVLVLGPPAQAQAAPSTPSSTQSPLIDGSPCPVAAPVKSFGVDAIDVNIPLNRFGDHDPSGKMYVLTSINTDQTNGVTVPTDAVAAVRVEELAQTVSIGLRTDPIQPLILRVNEGDCVHVSYTDSAADTHGLHIDGLEFASGSSGDAVGLNESSAATPGETRSYEYYVPDDPTMEGAHYVHPGPGDRDAISHGLFGALVVEPPGSTYLDPNPRAGFTSAQPLFSGWEAMVLPSGDAAFRENVQLYHELGNELAPVVDRNQEVKKIIDPHTGTYRPGSRLINYRSEPFMNRLDGPNGADQEASQAYGSYTFADPATLIPRGYLADPTKFRIMHAGSEMFHVFHMHGGGIRWRANPHADPTFNYADTGLQKNAVSDSESERLDSQSMGPGESYDLEIEGGAGGVQQGAGEFLFHCHIAEHYVAGMWSFWRVYNTLQPDFLPLPDRQAPPVPATSAELIGKTYNGVKITKSNLAQWITPQLPPQGTRLDHNDASVWDWRWDPRDPTLALGEADDLTSWPDDNNSVPGHPSAYPGDRYTGSLADRPAILFDPTNGRPAFPMMRPHVGMRPPFSANGHSGAPYLGESADQTQAPKKLDPFAQRPDGLCPQAAATNSLRRYNVTAITLPIAVTQAVGGTDPNGMIFTLSKNIPAVRAGTKPAEPLAIRANVGDCVAVTLTSELTDASAADGFSKVNMHIHHVQFDTQASDGVITGMSYEQSVRPYKVEDTQLAASVNAGAKQLKPTSLLAKFRPGVWIAIGEGTDDIEVRQIASVDRRRGLVVFSAPLEKAHAAGQWTGTEFTQYRWFPDVDLDNVFWHDHVDGIHTWGHGLVGQLVVEPRGSSWLDPTTGQPIDSGTIADIHTSTPLIPGRVNGDFRELVCWLLNTSPITDSTINLRAAPFSDRVGDPANRLSSTTFGDPNTPLPRAYPGDPFVIRTVAVGPTVDGLSLPGHRFWLENRYPSDAQGPEATQTDTFHYGVSEKFTLALAGGAGGPARAPGDYLYMNSVDRRFRAGAWGIIRVLPGAVPGLKPLRSNAPAATPPPPPTTPCPAAAVSRQFDIAAVDVKSLPEYNDNKVRAAFVPLAQATNVEKGFAPPVPLVLHMRAGECLTVHFTNRRTVRASFDVSELVRLPSTSGINVGNNPESTTAPGQSRDYVYYADTARLRTALVSDFGGDDTGKSGLYGAVVVAPEDTTEFTDLAGLPTEIGVQVDVHRPNGQSYRDATVLLSDDDDIIGQNVMPYPTAVRGPALLNYRSVLTQGRVIDANYFSSLTNGDPNTAVIKAYAGDPLRVHVVEAPGSEQPHVLSLGGLSWPYDPGITNAQLVQAVGLVPREAADMIVVGGAGGRSHTVGDYFFGDLRRPFTEGGMWGLVRSISDASCPIPQLDARGCTG